MTPVLIDLSNYADALVQSTQSRSGTPDGNIFFDTTNGRIELITAEELATVDLGSGLEANPLTNQLGIKFEAIYAFENQERRTDENLRKFDRFSKGTFKYGGAYELVNGRLFDDVNGSDTGTANNSDGDSDDRVKVRGSGWIERTSTGIGRIYFGPVSLGNVESASQAYYQILEGDAPINFAKPGPVDEGVKVYGDNNEDVYAYATAIATAAAQTISVVAAAGTFTRSSGSFLTDGFAIGDRFEAAGLALNTGTYTIKSIEATIITIIDEEWTLLTNESGDADEQLTVTGFDRRLYLSQKLRTFGYNYDEKVLADSGVSQMDGYSVGFAIGESVHLTSGAYALADVYGGAKISPWTGMTLEKLAVPQTETGFTTADGDFTWVLNNTVPGNLNQVVAFLDALAQTDDDIDSGAITVTNGKRVGTWYTYSADGKIQPRVGTGDTGEGLFIEGLVGTDKNRVIFTDDAGSTKIYPSYSNVSVAVGSDAVSDVLSWFHAFFLDGPAGADYNTANALTVEDSTATEVKGNVSGSGFRTANSILFEFDWYGDIIGGPIETDKDCVFLCEGDGGVTQAKTVFTLTSAASITASCIPLVETNV